MHKQFITLLKDGLLQCELDLSPTVIEKLAVYCQALLKWNRTYNLTAITDPKAIVTHHILDSLSLHPYLSGTNLLDVGSGAGLPGIPLALANPHRRIYLLDSNGKKIRFLRQMCFELTLDNTVVVHSRVESYQPNMCFDNIISRAFTSLAEMIQCSGHLLCSTGRFLAMKGTIPTTELEAIGDSNTVVGIHQLQVPGLEAERHLIVIEESHRG